MQTQSRRRAAAQARHLAWPIVAWLAGLAWLHQCAVLPTEGERWGLLAVALALGLLAAWGGWRGWSAARLCALASLGLALLAVAQGAWRAELRLAEALPEAWEGRDIRLRGRIASLPLATTGMAGTPGWRFEFEVERALDGNPALGPAVAVSVPSRISLSWYAGDAGDEALSSALSWQPGSHWELLVRLRRPHGLSNPHAFDYELWLFEQDLRASGVIRPGGATLLPGRLDGRDGLDRARLRLREAIRQRLAGSAASAGVLVALSLGDQAAISREDWALFRDTGVAHLMSISGLHVTMFAWLAQALVARLWRRSAGLCLRWPAPSAARWGGVAAALLYAMFAGFGVPAQRTVWMLLSLALLRAAGLRWPWPLSLLASALVVTAIDPWALCQAGFWLSFVAVGLLMSGGDESPATPERGAWMQTLRSGLRSQCVATLGLAPLGLLFFHQLSVVGLAANLLAIPLVSFVVTPLALLGSVAPWLWDLGAWCEQALHAYLVFLQGLPGAVWYVPVAPPWAQAAALLGGVLLVMRLPWHLRVCGALLCLPLLWPAPPRVAPGEFEVLAADVGQGTAVLLRTQSHALLYDAGPQYSPSADAGQRVLLPLLRALGVHALDLLMLSHRDSDHVGGADSLLQALPVRALQSSLEPGHALLNQGLPHRPCQAGQAWVWDGVQFEVLHPPAGFAAPAHKSNARSCVLRVQSASGQALLLTGDLEAPQEQALLKTLPAAQLRAEMLMVPHHGSKTSSSEAFLDAVAPRMALVQAGYRNRFGHPAPAVLARYQSRGVAVFSSPDCGAWRWASGSAEPVCEREASRRYWHALPAAAELPGPWPATANSMGSNDDQGF
jgi:competence protein ComEC